MTKTSLSDKQKTEITNAVRDRIAAKSTIANEAKTLTRGERGLVTGSQITFTATGAGVSTPFRRNYLKKALTKLNIPGATITVQKTARKSGETNIVLAFCPFEAAPVLEAAQTVETAPAPEAVEA